LFSNPSYYECDIPLRTLINSCSCIIGSIGLIKLHILVNGRDMRYNANYNGIMSITISYILLVIAYLIAITTYQLGQHWINEAYDEHCYSPLIQVQEIKI
jgi:hypothetical protein